MDEKFSIPENDFYVYLLRGVIESRALALSALLVLKKTIPSISPIKEAAIEEICQSAFSSVQKTIADEFRALYGKDMDDWIKDQLGL